MTGQGTDTGVFCGGFIRKVVLTVACASVVPVTILASASTAHAKATTAGVWLESCRPAAEVVDDTGRRRAAMSAICAIGANQSALCTGDVLLAAAQVFDGLPLALPHPQWSSSDDGEIGLSWFNGADHLEAVVGPGESLAWITSVNGSYERGDQFDVSGRSSLVPFYTALADFYASEKGGKSQR